MADEKMTSLNPEDSSYVMVAAIDFGTTYSGYAFSFINTPTAINMNKSWGQGLGFESYKTPTCLLTDGSGGFVAFGYEAEEKYRVEPEDDDNEEDSDDEKQTLEKPDLHLYKHFKMILHKEEKLSRTSKISSVDGKIAPALDIFTMSLKYLKDHLLTAVRRMVTSLDEDLIKWVLTVPAIWREEAKKFMREAAFQAGLMPRKDSNKLRICLEPEAASILCRNTEISQFNDDVKGATFHTGTKYIVVDAGGGTVDITVHEVLSTGNVRELHRATGGPWGGTKVDDKFVELLTKILGSDFINQFKSEHPAQWFQFMLNFEKRKKGAKPDGKSSVHMQMPWSIMDTYRSKKEVSIEKTIKDHAHLGVSFSQGVLKLNQVAINYMFESVTSSIATHVQDLLASPKIKDISYILLVGGFSESEYLQGAMKEVCEDEITMLVPSEAQMAIIKGAVLFGHKPMSIEARVARKTYGIKVANKCKEGEHNKKHTYKDKEGVLRVNKFKRFIEKDQEITIGEEKSSTVAPVHTNAKWATLKIISSEDPEVKYPTEDGVEDLGVVHVDTPIVEGQGDRNVKVKFIFGGTEIEVHATEVASGNTVKATIDFLSD